jgi:hypothetical protein
MHNCNLCGDMHRCSIMTQATSQLKKTGRSSDPITSGPCTHGLCSIVPKHLSLHWQHTIMLSHRTVVCLCTALTPTTALSESNVAKHELLSSQARHVQTAAAPQSINSIIGNTCMRSRATWKHVRVPQSDFSNHPSAGNTSMHKPDCKQATCVQNPAD